MLITAPAAAQEMTGTVSSTTTPLPESPGSTSTTEATPTVGTTTTSTTPVPDMTPTTPSVSAPPVTTAPPPTIPPEILAEIAAARADLDRVTQAVAEAEHERVRLETLYRTNQVRANAARTHLAEARAAVERRAVAAYKGHQAELLDIVLGSETAESLTNRRLLLEAVFAADADTLSSFRAAQARLADEEAALRSLTQQQIQAEQDVRAKEEDLKTRLDQADRLVKARLPGVNERPPLAVNGFVFPVGQPHSFSSDFGDYRAGPPVHSHQGNDIFAPYGTPLFAVVDGAVAIDEGGLGGRMLVLYAGDGSGTYYLYAHLQDWAPGMKDGLRVVAGQVVGFTGDTGNALGAPHCHFEIHPGGGPAVDPFPILTSADRGAAQALASPRSALPAPPASTDTVTALPEPPPPGPID